MALPLSSPLQNGVIRVAQKLQPRSFLSNQFTADASTVKPPCPDPRYVNLQNAPVGFDVASAVVYPGFVTEEGGMSLIKEVGKRLKRRRFENGHWDSVITGYREVELSTPDEQLFSRHNKNESELPMFANVIEETRMHLANNHFSTNEGGYADEAISKGTIRWLPSHAIDLSTNGELSAHVDSVKFSGEIVAGISLLSDAIMRLRPSSKEWDSEERDAKTSAHAAKQNNGGDSKGFVDLYLPRLSLYVLSGMSRYSYTHELLPSGSTFNFVKRNDEQSQHDDEGRVDVVRGRRLSIIFRDGNRS